MVINLSSTSNISDKLKLPSPTSYLFVIAKHYAHVSNARFSVVASLLPALAFVAKLMACSITDAHGIHKQFLMGTYILFATSFSSIGLIMFLKDPNDYEWDTVTWYFMIVFMALGYMASSCASCMNDALASNYARKNNKPYSPMRIWSNLGWASGAFFIMCIGNLSWLPFRSPGIILLNIAIFIATLFLWLWPYDEDFEMFHDGTTVEQRKLSIVGPNTMAYLAQSKPRGSISRDMLERIKTGRSKSVGNIPRMGGALAPLDLGNSMKITEPEEPIKEYSNFQCQLILLKIIATDHTSFIRYIVLFIVFGMMHGAIWFYVLDYVNLYITKGPAEFEFISNLCMVAQALLGEIPINTVASDMIRIFGANANMSIALVATGLRCFFYSQMLPYLGSISIIMAEALQGPSLGLYWILIVDIGSNYALMVTDYMPELRRRGIVRSRAHEEELSGCLRASMIGIMSSSMEGLGVALGSFIAGMLSNSIGYIWLWNLCAAVSITLGLLNISWDVVTKLLLQRKLKKTSDGTPLGRIPAVVINDMSKL